MSLVLKLVKFQFQVLSVIAPTIAAKKALKIFQEPHFQKTREREKDFLNNANIIRVKHDPEDIIIYEMGDKTGKPVLMVHGWDSNPGSLSGIAEQLKNNGFHIYSLNVPAHGISKQKVTNMLDVSLIIVEILKQLEKYNSISIVTHSFGSGAVTFALEMNQKEVDNLVFVTSPDKLIDIFSDFANIIGLNEKAYKMMIQLTENRFDKRFEDMEISKALSKVKFDKLLLVHDKEDKILPFENIKRINRKNPKSEIFATEAKGHYRILWDEEVISKIVNFLKGE